jgi:diaminopimelate decarboxylase
MSIRTAPATEELLGLFPPGSRLDGDGALMVGGCRLDDVAARFGTPAIVMSEDVLRQRARDYLTAFRSRWPGVDVAFASKSFPCTAVQRVMVEEGLHLDVAGGGEILTALKAGADPARLVLHGNAKTDEELELAVRHGVGLIVVDNFDDIDRLERIVPAGTRQPCLVRVIPGVEAATHASQATGHAGSKFGLVPDDARDAIPGSSAAPECGSTVCTPTSVRNCSTSSSWPPRSSRSPSSARSRSTTSAAASACATPTTRIRPRSTTTPTRW